MVKIMLERNKFAQKNKELGSSLGGQRSANNHFDNDLFLSLTSCASADINCSIGIGRGDISIVRGEYNTENAFASNTTVPVVGNLFSTFSTS